MRIALTVLGILLGILPLAGQLGERPGRIQWGPLHELPPGATIQDVVPASRARVYISRRHPRKRKGELVYLERYDSTNTLQQYRKILLNKGESLRQLFWNKGQLQGVLESSDLLRVIHFGNENLAPGITAFRWEKEAGQEWNELAWSGDSTRRALVLNERKGWQQRVQFVIRVFDEQWQNQWQRAVRLPYVNAEFYQDRVMVSSRGDVFISGWVQFGAYRQVVKGRPNFQYIVLAFTDGGATQLEYRVRLRNKIVTDFHVDVTPDGQLVGVGLYSESNAAAAGGVFFTRIDPISHKAISGTRADFSPEVGKSLARSNLPLDQIAEIRELSRKQGELLFFYIRNYIPRPDGGGLLVAEQIVLNENFISFNNGTATRQINYNFNDLLVLSLSPGGDLEWARKIPKRQRTTDDEGRYSSIVPFRAAEDVFLVYNDNGRNFTADPRRRLRNFNGMQSVIAATGVEVNGDVQSFPLFVNADGGVIFRPEPSRQIDAKTLLLYGEKGRKYRFGYLTFP